MPTGSQVGRKMKSWQTRNRKSALLLAGLVAISAILAFAGYAAVAYDFAVGGTHYIDRTFLFWAWSLFLHESASPISIYDPAIIYGFQHGIDHSFTKVLPFAYPPSFLLWIWPLSLIQRTPAYLLWMIGTLLAYLWACWRRPWGWQITMLNLVAPTTVCAIYAAQNALLIAALIIGGCRLLERRPVVAGVLFGLASFKPQFGLLIPVALVAAGLWRTVVAAGATVLLTILASGAAFGWSLWIGLPRALLGLSTFVSRHPHAYHLAPSITANLRMLGVGGTATDAGQFLAAALAATVVGLCWRRGPTRLAVAALMVGAFFATPYAFYYDLPLVSYAVLMIVLDLHETNATFGIGAAAVLALAIFLPVVMIFSPARLPYSGIALTSLLCLIARRALAVRHPTRRRLAEQEQTARSIGWVS